LLDEDELMQALQLLNVINVKEVRGHFESLNLGLHSFPRA
jgi:hypothetical protein